jgi:hypothetical protein
LHPQASKQESAIRPRTIRSLGPPNVLRFSGERSGAQRARCNDGLDGPDAVEEVDNAGFKGVLGADDPEAFVLNELFEQLRTFPEMVGRGTDVRTNCVMDEGVGVVGEGGVEKGLEGWAYALDDGTQVSRVLKRRGTLKAFKGSEDGTATGVTEDDNKTSVKPGSRELDAADLRGSDDVAGDTDNEEVAEALVKDEFGWDPRIGASQDDGEWLL